MQHPQQDGQSQNTQNLQEDSSIPAVGLLTPQSQQMQQSHDDVSSQLQGSFNPNGPAFQPQLPHLQPQIAQNEQAAQIEQQRYVAEESVSQSHQHLAPNFDQELQHQQLQQQHLPQWQHGTHGSVGAGGPPVGDPGLSLQDIERVSQAPGVSMANPQLQDNIAFDETLFDRFKVLQVGRILQLIAERGDMIPLENMTVTPFNSHEIPNINILVYSVVLSFNAGLHDQQAPLLLVLLERLCQEAARRGHPIFINSFTIHRLILATVLITSKMFNDTFYTNQYIASVGGTTLQNMNHLESFFMKMIDWNVFVSSEEFDAYDHSLANYQLSGQAAAESQQAELLSTMHTPASVAQLQLQPQPVLHANSLLQQVLALEEAQSQAYVPPLSREQQLLLQQQFEQEQLQLQVRQDQMVMQSPQLSNISAAGLHAVPNFVAQQQNSSYSSSNHPVTYHALAQNPSHQVANANIAALHPTTQPENVPGFYHQPQPQQMSDLGIGDHQQAPIFSQSRLNQQQVGVQNQQQTYNHTVQQAVVPQPLYHHQPQPPMPGMQAYEEHKHQMHYQASSSQHGGNPMQNTNWPTNHHQQQYVVQQQQLQHQMAIVNEPSNNEMSYLASLTVQAQQNQQHDHSPLRFDFHQMSLQIEEAQHRNGQVHQPNRRGPPRQ